MSAPAYKLVPVEPTEAMLRAGLETDAYGREDIHSWDDPQAVYRAMLAAAPAVQAGGEPVAWDASHIKQPGWNHVAQAFADGAREARDNPAASDADFIRAADGYSKRLFEDVDPSSEHRLRTGGFELPLDEATQPISPPMWVSVADRLPDLDGKTWVSVLTWDGSVCSDSFGGKWSWFDLDGDGLVTHWAPLPAGPGEIVSPAQDAMDADGPAPIELALEALELVATTDVARGEVVVLNTQDVALVKLAAKSLRGHLAAGSKA